MKPFFDEDLIKRLTPEQEEEIKDGYCFKCLSKSVSDVSTDKVKACMCKICDTIYVMEINV